MEPLPSVNGGLLSSNPFTKASGQSPLNVLDNLKYLALANTPVAIPSDGKLLVEMCLGVRTFNTGNNPFPPQIVQNNDVRLASGNFVTFDFATGLQFGFIFSNDRIYALYARSPMNDNIYSFVYMIPLVRREPADINTVGLVFDNNSLRVKYYVDGYLRLDLGDIGGAFNQKFLVIDYGGTFTSLYPTAITYGFGTSSNLNAYPVCKNPISHSPLSESTRYHCEDPELPEALVKTGDNTSRVEYNPLFVYPDQSVATYYDVTGATQNVLFGQGVAINLQRLIVATSP